MSKTIRLSSLRNFCVRVLVTCGMKRDFAEITAEVLTETDAYGVYSHGTKNLRSYIRKAEAGGMALNAEPEILSEGDSFALLDARHGVGMVASCRAMDIACEKALRTGIAIATVRNSTHFGSAGYYVNRAALRGMFGIALSNVDPNMTVPGAQGMIIGNNPISFASPMEIDTTIFLDISTSVVASLKVIQARMEGRSVPGTWIVDRDGNPTTDPSRYPEEGAMQPMSGHKGYGLAVMGELLTGVLSGGGISSAGDIVSWCFRPERHNNVSHTFIAIDIGKFIGIDDYRTRSCLLARCLHEAPKAKGVDRIYLPGEMEWERHGAALQSLELPADAAEQLDLLSGETGVPLEWLREDPVPGTWAAQRHREEGEEGST